MSTSDHWDDLARGRAREEKAERRQTHGREVPGTPIVSSAGRRLGAYLLDILLAIVTLGVGWLVWSLLAWRRGQSPAKQLLGMYVVHDARPASWKRMAAREILCKGIVGVICGLLARPTYGLSLLPYYFWLCFNVDREALWDRPAGTHVVEDRGF
jgi:uncharacterized RDD family membrane protein YckC